MRTPLAVFFYSLSCRIAKLHEELVLRPVGKYVSSDKWVLKFFRTSTSYEALAAYDDGTWHLSGQRYHRGELRHEAPLVRFTFFLHSIFLWNSTR